MCPKLSDIQCVWYVGGGDYVRCPVAGRDHFGPWCFCPASKQQITNVPLDCVCVDENVWPHYLRLCNYISNAAGLRLCFFVLNMQLSSCHRPCLQIHFLRPTEGPDSICWLKAFRSLKGYAAKGRGQKINSWPVSGLVIHKLSVIWEHPRMAYPYILHSHD